jgi:hypothetical protein
MRNKTTASQGKAMTKKNLDGNKERILFSYIFSESTIISA